MVIFGVEPNMPSTGYGYLQIKNKNNIKKKLKEVIAFENLIKKKLKNNRRDITGIQEFFV